ncbi:hypothetical protein [Bdellovibrio sp. HCB337]|uniref:hypothetical protein n=1 Tax=Bdellovibrio sp. HCB337 TaxID=3394358 RepID=UPI0039A5C2A8
MNKNRRFFLKWSALGIFSTWWDSSHRAVAGMIPFAFWKTSAKGTVQVTQAAMKVALQGGSPNVRTTQIVAKVAGAGGAYHFRTTRVVAKTAVVGGAYGVHTTRVVAKVAVVP